MKLKTAAAALCAAMIITNTCGCSINLSKEDMLRPPKTMGDEAEIEQLISNSAPNGYTLKYPKSGANRSAITMHDLDDDNVDEAIAFFRDKGGSTGVRMLVMFEEDGVWKISGDYLTETTDVDCVLFADINASGSQEILVGYTTYTAGVNFLSVYTYSDGKTDTIEAGQNYSAFYCGVVDSSGKSSVMTLSLFTHENDAKATLLEYDEQSRSLNPKASVAMDPNIISYKCAAFSELSESVKGLVIDGVLSNGDLNTQIIYYNKDMNALRNPLYNEKSGNLTQRSSDVISTDIDNDMKYEIPTVSELPFNINNENMKAATQVMWNKFSAQKEQLLPAQRTAANFSYNYTINIPETWQAESFTALMDKGGALMSFREWKNNSEGKKIFDIVVFKAADWEQGKSNEKYTLIYKDNRYAYTFFNYEPESSLALSDDAIKTAFSLLSGSKQTGNNN